MLNDALLACQEEVTPAKFDPNPASPITARATLRFFAEPSALGSPNLKNNAHFPGIMELNSCTSVDNACPHSRPFCWQRGQVTETWRLLSLYRQSNP